MLLIADFFIWWYTVGWIQRVRTIGTTIKTWLEYFSFGILLKTLFKPWKQIVSAADGHQSFDQKKDALVSNLVSRFVGFMVRSLVLIFGAFVIAGIAIAQVLYVIIWPLIPLSPVLALVAGLAL